MNSSKTLVQPIPNFLKLLGIEDSESIGFVPSPVASRNPSPPPEVIDIFRQLQLYGYASGKVMVEGSSLEHFRMVTKYCKNLPMIETIYAPPPPFVDNDILLDKVFTPIVSPHSMNIYKQPIQIKTLCMKCLEQYLPSLAWNSCKRHFFTPYIKS